MNYEVPVWHIGKPEKNIQIQSKKLITTGEKGNWLGDCLYFWDTKSNAADWAKTNYQSKSVEYTCLAASLKFSDDLFLDFTDNTINNMWSEMWIEMAKDLGLDNYANYDEGLKLNILWKSLDDEDKKFMTVIKAIGIYKGGKDKFYYKSGLKKTSKPRPHIDNTRAKIMYGVRDVGVIHESMVIST